MDLLEITGYAVGGLGVSFVGLVGYLQGRNNYSCATQLYDDLPENAKEAIGKPNKTKIYLQSMIDAPKFIYCTTKNKCFNNSFFKYVAPLEERFGTDYIKLLILKHALKGY